MRGLLLKDIYMQKQYLKQYVVTLLFFSVFAVILKSPSYLTFMGLVLGLTQMFTVISIDESGGFTYCLTLPVSRRKIVQEKYLLFLIELIVIFAATSVIGGIIAAAANIPVGEWMPQVLGAGCFYLLVISVVVPVALKWKVEKARILMLGMILIPVMLIILGSKLMSQQKWSGFFSPIVNTLSGGIFYVAAALVLVVIVSISYLISVQIFLKKEF